MRINVKVAAAPDASELYRQHLSAELARVGLDAQVSGGDADPSRVDYIVYSPDGDLQDFTPYGRCRLVLSLWAGVDRIVGNPTLTQPLCRMIDPGLTAGMAEWVAAHVLRHHLAIDRHLFGQDGIWRREAAPPLAAERPVCVLGLGELGRACAGVLAGLNFPVAGWSRSARDIAGVTCHAGEEGLLRAVGDARILVLMLPLTSRTRGIVNRRMLDALHRGVVLINPARGGLIVDRDLLQALESGRVGHATLDVFDTEPLPPAHPYWTHPRVTVTPHVAAATRPASASRTIAENILRSIQGRSPIGLVDRSRGY